MKRTLAVLAVLGIACAASATPYSGAVVSVCDIAGSDVPGPQPIRAFPVPAAAGWTGAQLIYDNYAEGLPFSAGIEYPQFSWVSLPLGNANVTINGVDYDAGVTNLVVNNGFDLLVNEEGDDADPLADDRFPYHIPRPGRFCGEWFTALQFDLATPTDKFGVFLPAHTNTWNSTDPAMWFDDHNFVLQTCNVHVFVQGVGDTFADAQHESVLTGGSYCPFLMVEYNGTDPIKAVTIIHDCYADLAPTYGFMDVYVPEPSCAVLLALGVLGLRRRSRA